ncbi:uncharacterized protein ACRADG_009794 [Cochliomyia hominivorax]
MRVLKFLSITALIMAIGVAGEFIYNTKYIDRINDVVVVQGSNTCVVLVVQDKIKFVSTLGNASKELAKYSSYLQNQNLEVVRANFIPLNTMDLAEKLSKIGSTRDTFLVYFTASEEKLSGSVTVVKKEPVGLLGNLLGALGINIGDKGLLKLVTDLLGVETNVEKVTTVDF